MADYPYNPNPFPSAYNPQSVPQYTQAYINSHYQQWGSYPPAPYWVIDEYGRQTYFAVAPTYPPNLAPHFPSFPPSGQSLNHTSTVPNILAPPQDEETLRRRRSRSDRRSRSRTPSRTWTCDYPNCTSTANFTRLADLQRHQSTVHASGPPGYPCYVPRCSRVGDKGFTRRDHLVEHLRNFHHLNIDKRKQGERTAYPTGVLPPYPDPEQQ
ncbi:hypothetical protein CC78DRAFT_91801 [Lojkania enalia]|uniref:C2H2-type domain-containing protein n=1 Tax=Lojkania enalia TaxID=147567 RepID=A0A9P4KIE2_9PLEO|nr:hypothetical protein CC78DRAFT_91801 [Didymosphaeria enalia]